MARRKTAGRMRRLTVTPAFKAFVLDQLEEFGDVSSKPMFGAIGLYHRGVFFGIVAADTLYLRVDQRTIGDYERLRMKPFRPFPGRAGSRRYYEVPLAVLESPTELALWAKRAIAAASTAG
jgi:DNA transformation protein